MRLEALGGTSDLLPAETARWQAVESRARRVLAQYGYQEIRTPILENAQVFLQSLGEATEIVQKQMYLFEDRGGRTVALRPEGTASAVRAYLEHGFDKTSPLQKWYYLGPMFRAERPQAGRRRQFHQLGVEAFGSASPYQDAEVIALLMQFLQVLGLTKSALKVNNLGCRNDRPKMLEALKAYFTKHRDALCEDCRARLATNPLRILDCKQEGCRKLVAGSPTPDQWVCGECREHVTKVLESLRTLRVAYQEDKHLVRGLDYYTKTAFEVTHEGLGAQDAVGGGGRYDELVEQMGGPAVPAVGWAVGMERLLMAMDREKPVPSGELEPRVFVATLGSQAREKGWELLNTLLQSSVSASADYDDRPLKRQLELANRLGCEYVVLIGDDELNQGKVTLKDMSQHTQKSMSQDDCVKELTSKLIDRKRVP